ncbi:MAG: imidazole glycerol phosphate synthase subunit HisH [Agarilytica sp.]
MSKQHIAVIDYGMGNLHSVASALAKVAPDAHIDVTQDIANVAKADRVIFPGVGAIRDCVAEIKRLKFDEAVAKVISDGRPLLAICVGMQSLMQRSEENNGVTCLGELAGDVRFFSDNSEFNAKFDEASSSHERLKVPHMGWNQVQQKTPHAMWENIPQDSRFYFVHSYYVQVTDPNLMAASTHYGIDFTSVIARDNVFAVQFHPEKSHTHGLQLLKNFVGWNGQQN